MLRIRQIVFVVRDLASTSRQLAELLALDPPYRDPAVAEFGLDNAVFVFGDQFIELISPMQGGTAVGRHLERRGEGGYMLIVGNSDENPAKEEAYLRLLAARRVDGMILAPAGEPHPYLDRLVKEGFPLVFLDRDVAELRGRLRPRVLLSGLGMGFTLRAALDELADDADVTVAELNPVVVEWCKGPLASLIADAARDRRVTMQVVDQYYKHLRLERGRMLSDSRALGREFDVRPNEPRMVYAELSGGNQQKALLAKWLQGQPRLLLLHEPTQGVDVGARQQIFAMIRAAAAGVASVVCASADYEQLGAICDRVLIFAR